MTAREIVSPRVLKVSLTAEIAFAGIYLAMTRSLFVIYLVSAGFDVSYISLIVLISTFISTSVSVLLYKFPEFVVKRVKLKFLLFHATERLLWIPIGFTSDPIIVTICYAGLSTASVFIGVFMNTLIYGSFDEQGVRDITSKRTAAFNIMSVLGFVATMVLIAILPGDLKFPILFSIGGGIGILSTVSLIPVNMVHLEGMALPRGIEKPEQVFSTSSFTLALLVSSGLLGLVWAPYLIDGLGAPDFMAVGINLAGTVAGIGSSLVWAKRSLKTFRAALALSTITPIIVILTPIPVAHLGISAFWGFAYTGASFLGSFLFARYTLWFGAVRSSIIMTILANLSQLLATPFGMILGGNYFLLFISLIAILALSNVLAFLTIPEVAIIPEESARTYSQLLYSNSLTGYTVAVETTKETVLLTLRLLALSIALLTLYIAYRFLLFLIGV